MSRRSHQHSREIGSPAQDARVFMAAIADVAGEKVGKTRNISP